MGGTCFVFEERFFFTEKLVSVDRTKLLSGRIGRKRAPPV